jgi:succinate dehydrogenase (ubiquinone) flavoprotein subunit
LAQNKPGDPVPSLPTNAGQASIDNVDSLLNSNGDIPTAQLRLDMQRTMQKHAAVFRTGPILQVNKQRLFGENIDFDIFRKALRR